MASQSSDDGGFLRLGPEDRLDGEHAYHRPDEAEVEIRADTAKRVNFASAQNAIPVVRRLEITNAGGVALENLTVTLSASPPVIRSKSWVIDRIAPGASLALSDLATPLDVERLAGLNESEIGTLTVTVAASDGLLAEEKLRLELLDSNVVASTSVRTVRFGRRRTSLVR